MFPPCGILKPSSLQPIPIACVLRMVLRVTLAMVLVTKLTKIEPDTMEMPVPMMPSQRSAAVSSSTLILKDEDGNLDNAHSKPWKTAIQGGHQKYQKKILYFE